MKPCRGSQTPMASCPLLARRMSQEAGPVPEDDVSSLVRKEAVNEEPELCHTERKRIVSNHEKPSTTTTQDSSPHHHPCRFPGACVVVCLLRSVLVCN